MTPVRKATILVRVTQDGPWHAAQPLANVRRGWYVLGCTGRSVKFPEMRVVDEIDRNLVDCRLCKRAIATGKIVWATDGE